MDPEKVLQEELKQALSGQRDKISRDDIVDILQEAVNISQADICRTIGIKPSAIFVHIACIAFALDGKMIHPDDFPRIVMALNGEEDPNPKPLRTCNFDVDIRAKVRCLDQLRVAIFRESRPTNIVRPQPKPDAPTPKKPRIQLPGAPN